MALSKDSGVDIFSLAEAQYLRIFGILFEVRYKRGSYESISIVLLEECLMKQLYIVIICKGHLIVSKVCTINYFL